ncbi:MAG: DUF357 domain-containing protein [Candidatus ainarchaeum sp.]|nr:DUF357 domain-containing protein [Candidatus ainarchaeum sp.]MDD3976236.1 DUF357 domain-containing protein [Candidatus ainarchaeum sp.]
MNTELEEYALKYKLLLEKALSIIKINIENESFLRDMAKDYEQMAKNYLKDGNIFIEKKDHKRALAAFSYAYGWIDSGVRIGLFYGIDRNLFTLYK